jgi:hypothetical protein
MPPTSFRMSPWDPTIGHTWQICLHSTGASHSAYLWSVPYNTWKAQFYRYCFVEMISYCNYRVISIDRLLHSGFTGCTFVCDKHMFRFQLNNISSVYSAEHYAIYRVFLYVSHKSQRHFFICSDALSAIQSSGIHSWPPSHSSNSVKYVTSTREATVLSCVRCQAMLSCQVMKLLMLL